MASCDAGLIPGRLSAADQRSPIDYKDAHPSPAERWCVARAARSPSPARLAALLLRTAASRVQSLAAPSAPFVHAAVEIDTHIHSCSTHQSHSLDQRVDLLWAFNPTDGLGTVQGGLAPSDSALRRFDADE